MVTGGQAKYYDGERKVKIPKYRRTFTVAKMNEIHHEIARRLVLGQKGTQIAKDLSISPATVTLVKNSPIVREQMGILSGARDKRTVDIRAEIEELAPRCVDVIRNQLEDEQVSAHLKSKNAFSLLSIVGFSPVRNVNVKSVSAILSGEDIERINAKATEARQRALEVLVDQDVIEATVDES